MRASAKLISTTHPTLNFAHPALEPFTWNTIIRAHVHALTRPCFAPISIYFRMRFHGICPDIYTFPFLLPSFNSQRDILFGRKIHAQVIVFGLAQHYCVRTSLINMYSCCEYLSDSRLVFDEVIKPDLPSWNSMINGYVKAGWISMARDLFDEMPERNVISWSCMIDGYVRSGKFKEALGLFREMQMLGVDDVRPNEYTMSCVLSACGRLGVLEHGEWAHAYINNCRMKIEAVLGTSLIDMYAKCGSIEKARSVFNRLGEHKDVTTWTAMVSGLALHGRSEESLQLFSEMINQGMRPDDVTVLGVLCACVHGGLVSVGKDYFERMKEDFGISPSIRHFGCMVDLYGRAGMLDEARNLVKTMPMRPDVLIWGSLMSGARMHGDIETFEFAVNKLIELDPGNSSAYVVLSNMHAKMGRWREVGRIRTLMEKRVAEKVPACSLVEVGGVLHEFFAGDSSHPESREMCWMVNEIMQRLKLEGYVREVEEVLLLLD